MKDESKVKYTQREWDRVVGWGKVPSEYAYPLEELDSEGEIVVVKVKEGEHYD